jgi:hypothetical protein
MGALFWPVEQTAGQLFEMIPQSGKTEGDGEKTTGSTGRPPMRGTRLLMELESAAARLGIQVVHEKLPGTRSGLCRLRDQHLLFVDKRLRTEEQIEVFLTALSRFSLENLQLLPRVRELLEQYREREKPIGG